MNSEDAEKRAEVLNKANPKLECKAVILADFIEDFAQNCEDAGYKMAMQRVNRDEEVKP